MQLGSVSRELILPATRLHVPERPSAEHLAFVAQRSADAWTSSPADWAEQQVLRLAVAALLRSRVGDDGGQAALGSLAAGFRPHVDLVAQAFCVGVVEAVNAGVPAVSDPLREALRRLGVTGRERVQMLALGFDKVPPRGRTEFWKALRTSAAVTALVDAVAAGPGSGAHDVSSLDRSQLGRADAVLAAGGRTLPLTIGTAPAGESGRSWLSVPLNVTRRGPGQLRTGTVELGLRGEGWTEVFDQALLVLAAAMHEIDLGGRPRLLQGAPPAAAAFAARLVAARQRPVDDVVTSLEAVDPVIAELYGSSVRVEPVRVAVPVIEDDAVMQLWLPDSQLAGPLVTGAADLFFGAGSDVRSHGAGGAPGAKRPGGRPEGRGRPDGGGGRGPQRPQPPRDDAEPGGNRRNRRGRKRPAPAPDATPATEAPAPETPAPSAPEAPTPAPEAPMPVAPASAETTQPDPTPKPDGEQP